jgi:F-type H+-transporting ATPase subunit epsilon
MPTQTVADERCDMVVLRTADGDKGILRGHEPCAAALVYGPLRVYRGKQEEASYTVVGGLARVYGDQVVVLSPIADTTENIDAAIENIRRDRDENQRREQNADFEMNRAETALRRSLVHNEGSAFAIIRGKIEKDG